MRQNGHRIRVNWRRKRCNRRHLHVDALNRVYSPNSVSVKIGGQSYKGLVDTGAELSLINEKVYQRLHHKPVLEKTRLGLQTADGSLLRVKGITQLQFKLGNQYTYQKCVVVQNLNRLVILGRDWFRKYGVRIYYDLGTIRLNGEYIPLEEDIHMSNLATLAESVTLKPQHIHRCVLQPVAKQKIGHVFELEQVRTGELSNLSGVLMVNSVVRVGRNQTFQVGIVNNTNQTVSLRRGWPVAKLSGVNNIQRIPIQSRHKDKSNIPDLAGIKVPEAYQREVGRLIDRNIDRFASEDKHLGRTNTVRMRIDTGREPPIKKRPYPTPLAQRQAVEETIEEMLKAGLITRSRSPWGFPIVLVKKKDGSQRFCVDYRDLNKITRRNAHPLPLIEHILATLRNAKYFSKLDLKSGFHQVELDEDSKQKTAFACHNGLFQWNVMPFGLANAPGIFQELMSIVLQGLECYSLAYLDDVLIFSSSKEEHLAHLQKVFDRLRSHNLKLKPSKCEFFNEETQYLGFRISNKGIQPDPEKVRAIEAVQPPKTVREVRGFLGMCSYYRRFIPEFSSIAESLTNLTRKGVKFVWDDRCQNAFVKLKQGLAKEVILAYPDPSKPYKLYTDASDLAIGASLTQEVYDPELRRTIEKPIHFISHKLSDTQTRWATIEKEAFAIHFALQKLHHYLYSATFKIFTDHKPLERILKSPMKNRKIQLWALAIAGYNCEIVHLPGKDNLVADLLSRSSAAVVLEDTGTVTVDERAFQINVINSNKFNPRDFAAYKPQGRSNSKEYDRPTIREFDMATEQKVDEELSRLKKRLETDKASKSEQMKYMIDKDIVYYLSQPEDDPIIRLYVPGHLCKLVLEQFHTLNGHMGIAKTFHSIKRKYYWPGLFKDVTTTVNKCVPCQTRNLRKIRPQMQESDRPPFPFAKVALDVTGPYPKTHSGNMYIATFIDMYSAYPECFAIPNRKGQTMANLIMEEIFPRYGAPLQLLTDNGPENVNSVMKRTLDNLNIHHVTTSFYRPQSNGKVERLHRTMNDILAKSIGDNSQSWDLHLNQMLAAIRFSVNRTTGFSPFYMLYSRDVVLPLDNLLRPRSIYYGDQFHEKAIQEQHRIFMRANQNVKKATAKQIERANKNSSDIQYKVGDFVYLRNDHRSNKLDQRWKPHYVIIEKTSPVSYRLKDQLTGNITKAHAERIRLAKVDEWILPPTNRPMRKVVMAAPTPTERSSSERESSTGGNMGSIWIPREKFREGNASDLREELTETGRPQDSSGKDEINCTDNRRVLRSSKRLRLGSDSENPGVKRHRHEREGSSSEHDIPIMERKLAQDMLNQGASSTDQLTDDIGIASCGNIASEYSPSDTTSEYGHTPDSELDEVMGVTICKGKNRLRTLNKTKSQPKSRSDNFNRGKTYIRQKRTGQFEKIINIYF